MAAGIFAAVPTFVRFSPVLATEHVFLALTMGAIIVATRATNLPTSGSIAPGLLLGLAIITRGESVFYVPAFLLFVLIGRRSVDLRCRLRCAAMLIAAIGLVVVPWYVRNAVVVDPDSGLSAIAGHSFSFAVMVIDALVGSSPHPETR